MPNKMQAFFSFVQLPNQEGRPGKDRESDRPPTDRPTDALSGQLFIPRNAESLLAENKYLCINITRTISHIPNASQKALLHINLQRLPVLPDPDSFALLCSSVLGVLILSRRW